MKRFNWMALFSAVILMAVPMLIASAAKAEDGVVVQKITSTEAVVAVNNESGEEVVTVIEIDSQPAQGDGSLDCAPFPNSTGESSHLEFMGNGDFSCGPLPMGGQLFGQLIGSRGTTGGLPMGGGWLCLNWDDLNRVAPHSAMNGGTIMITLNPPPSVQMLVGETWNFQFFHRDPYNPDSLHPSNLSSIERNVTLTPDDLPPLL